MHDGYTEGKTEVEAVLDKRLVVIESEFANVPHQGKREGNTLFVGPALPLAKALSMGCVVVSARRCGGRTPIDESIPRNAVIRSLSSHP